MAEFAPSPISNTSISAAQQQVAAGSTSYTALVQACLQRISTRDQQLCAWSYVDAAGALAQAERAERARSLGPLNGMAIGIKDVIDTNTMPTAYGSPIYAGFTPKNDAYCVTAMKRSGAVILGKNHTSEFAHTAPAATRNPHNPEHTPGGSSGGSAAAVAAGMAYASLATQTGGSIIRPAAFCGVVGFKPSFGLLNRVGLKTVAESLDTLGIITNHVSDVAIIFNLLLNDYAALPTLTDAPRIGFCKTPYWDNLSAQMQSHILAVADTLSASGARLSVTDWPTSLNPLNAGHRLIMNYEAARSLRYEYEHFPELISPALFKQLEYGWQAPLVDYLTALAQAETARQDFAAWAQGFDFILTPAVQDVAPAGIASSGDSLLSRTWTTLGVPCIALPTGLSQTRLPLGIQLVGHYREDRRLLAWAAWARAQLATGLEAI